MKKDIADGGYVLRKDGRLYFSNEIEWKVASIDLEDNTILSYGMWYPVCDIIGNTNEFKKGRSFNFKKGDSVSLREGIEVGKVYRGIRMYSWMMFDGSRRIECVEIDGTARIDGMWYPITLIERVKK